MRDHKRKKNLVISGLLILFLGIGCASSGGRDGLTGASRIDKDTVTASRRPEDNRRAGVADKLLRQEVNSWIGTPHVLGGNTKRGVDCSGFVLKVYKNVYGKTIPRTTALQVKTGRRINRDSLRIGDLVFFKPDFKKRHVGIYLGSGQFAHTSYSRGVRISKMSNPYWKKYYWTARRYN